MNFEERVLVVDFNGTAPLYTFYLAKGFKDCKCKVNILGCQRQDFFLSPPQDELYIGHQTQLKPLNYILNWLYLFWNANKYDLIVIQWLQMLKYNSLEVFFLSALQKRNKNTYYLVHNLIPHNSKSRKIEKRYSKLYKKANNILVHTEKAKSRIHNLFGMGKNILLIEHGYFYYEFQERYVFQKSNIMILTGRISKYKGIEDAIKVLAILKKKGLDIKLKIQGKGEEDYVKELRKLGTKFGMDESLALNSNFVSASDLIDLHKSAFCSILPYKKIEQSGVIFTSLGLNVPVVGYDVGGFSRIVKAKENGILVKKGEINNLADAVEWIYLNQRNVKETLVKNQKEDFWKKSANLILNNNLGVGK